MLVRAREHFLEDVLGVRLRQPECLDRDRVDITREALDEIRPGLLVSRPAPRDELTVAERGHHGWDCDGYRGGLAPLGALGGRRLTGVLAELLRPPFRLAAVEVLLELRDVHGEVTLPRRQLGLELGARLLPLLEPLLADLELGLQLRLAQIESGFALLELLGTAGEHLLPLVESLFLALVATARREDGLLRLVERSLARRELLVSLLHAPLGQLVDLRL